VKKIFVELNNSEKSKIYLSFIRGGINNEEFVNYLE
jgi:hypothetical protein